METPQSEPARIRHAVAESVRIGTLTGDLISMISVIVRRRVRGQLADDIQQDVLIKVLTALPRIDLAGDCYAYVCQTIVVTWRAIMRRRRVERRHMIETVYELLAELPLSTRARAAEQAWVTVPGLFKLKYY